MRILLLLLLVTPLLILTACSANRSGEPPAGDARRYFELGQTAEHKGDAQVAAMMYQAASDADPQDTASLLALARLQLKAGQAEAAARLYERVLAAAPDADERWRAYNGLGVARSRLNDPAAEAAFAQALELAPEAERAAVRRNLAVSKLSRGTADSEDRELLQAVKP